MNNLKFIYICILLLTLNTIRSQTSSFSRIDTVQVKISGSTVKNPWAGGLNWCQFSAIDMNLDGIKDLFVFDRSGNKITTFINNGTANTVDYKHAPQYQSKFPVLHDWALLVDYNCDGKEDIFTYSLGGMALYKNVSNPTDGLKFQSVTGLLYSNYSPPNGTPCNLYVSSVDIPAITDIDNDGDVDIVTLGLFGTTAEFHQNKSQELYGVCDNIDKFQVNTSCWGKFIEASFTNIVSLGVSCKGGSAKTDGIVAKTMHSGSCELCLDMDGDGDKEIMLGGISYNNYTLLTNGGTVSNADMTSQDANFPSADVPVNLTSFPCGFHLDVNNDGLNDVLISPNSPYSSENFTSVLYYKNAGTASNVDLKFQQNDFLQNQMIETGEGAYPVFFDYNADGLLDLLIGNYGYYASGGIYQSKISLYKNTGTVTNPQFDLVTRDFSNLSLDTLYNISPSFGDLDGDGDADMMVGEYNGYLYYYRNTAGAGNPATFVLAQTNYKDAGGTVIDVGQFAAPQIVDVDRDGKNDLIIGARNGKINYYLNTGTAASPSFTLVTSNFGGVNVTKQYYFTGYSYPCLFEAGNSYKLMVGSENGYLYYYGNIDGNLSGNFTLLDSMYLNAWEGSRTAPAIADINNDGLNDMVVGNYSGGVGLYGGMIINSIDENKLYDQLTVDLYPNPSTNNFMVRINNFDGFSLDNYIKNIKVFNLIGQEVIHQEIVGNIARVNTFGLQEGVYLCEVSMTPFGKNSPVYRISRKLIVQGR